MEDKKMMFWIGGVWDPRLRHRIVGGLGLMSLFLVAYIGARLSGEPFFLRFLF
jgi:hypothetical protein